MNIIRNFGILKYTKYELIKAESKMFLDPQICQSQFLI